MIRTSLFVVLTTCLYPVAAAAQSPVPYKKEKEGDKQLLSFQLEQQFSSFMSGCSGVKMPLKMEKPSFGGGSSKKEVSAIDFDVIDGLKLQRRDYIFQNHWELSLGRIFGYVHTDPEKVNPAWSIGQFLRIAYEDQGKILAAGFPELRYEATCGSVIEGATRFSGEYSFPVATIKGALAADYNDEKKSSLQVARGKFLSPIWQMWAPENASTANTSYRFYAGLLFWDWLSDKPAGNYSLIRSFDGTFLFRQTERQSGAKVNMSAEATVALPITSISGNIGMEGARGASFSYSSFHTYVDVKAGTVDTVSFEPLPTAETIVTAVRQNVPRSEVNYTNGQIIESEAAKIFWVDIFSMPALYCNGSWEVRDTEKAAAPSSALAFASVKPAGGTSTACRFTFSYTPALAGPSEVMLTPTLFSKSARDNQRLIVPTGSAAYSRNVKPAISLVKPHPMEATPVVGKLGNYELVWKLDFRVDDDGKFANIASINVDGVQMSCPENTFTSGVPVFTRQFVGEPGPSVRTLQLIGKAQYSGPDPTTIGTAQCSLAGTVNFWSGAGASAIRSVQPVPLTYPLP